MHTDMSPHTPPVEAARLAALGRYAILDTPAEAAFDRFVDLARRMLGVKMSLISFVDRDRQWIKARVGADLVETPRHQAFCDHVIRGEGVMIVPDATRDERFATNPYVTGAPYVRFYAGAPLVTPDHQRIGTLCVLDDAPHDGLDSAQIDLLADLARSVVTELELRHEVAARGRLIEELEFWQGLSRDIAAAADFGAALDRVLAACAARTGAASCMVVERDRRAGTARQIAVHVRDDAPAPLATAARWAGSVPIAHLGCGLTLANGETADTGPLDAPEDASGLPALRRLVDAGIRRQLGFPFRLHEREFGLLIGFDRPDVPVEAHEFIDELLSRIRTLLRGRAREEALNGSRQALLTTLLKGRMREDELDRSRALLRQSNRVLRTLRATAEAMARAADETAFFREICRLVVEEGGYTACWIGLAGAEPDCALTPAAFFGSGLDHLPGSTLSWADRPEGRGPTGTAIRERRLVVSHDIATDPRFDPWRAVFQEARFVACASVPLAGFGQAPFGGLSIFSRNPFPFESEERTLLGDLAQEVVRGREAVANRAGRAAAEAARQDAETRLSRVLDAGPAILYAGTFEAAAIRVTEVSGNIARILGHAPEQARGAGWWRAHLHPADRSRAIAEVNAAVESRHLVHHYRLAAADGDWRWIRDEMMVEADAGGRTARVSGVWMDVTERRAAEDRIHRLAFSDPLTGLPNRQALHDRLGQLLTGSLRSGQLGALLLIDMDRFKLVNDLFGHSGGDAAMVEAAKRFRAALREEDTLARFTGDEFVVLLPRLGRDAGTAVARAREIGERLLAALGAGPARLRDRDYALSARAGLTLFPGAAADAETLLGEADIAMYQAKASETERIVSFEPSMQAAILEEVAVEEALRAAIAEDRFELWLQDQVAPSRRMVAAEALVRLRRADGLLLLPGQFIDVAERSGLIAPIGQRVLHAVCRLLAGLGAACLGEAWPGGRIAVNVSPRQFRDPDFVSDVEAALAAHGIGGERLTIEITEGLLIDRIEDAAATMRRLAAHGVRFSVDDFGTGYSSLRYLQRLPIDEVKIDRSFIAQLPDNPRSAAICEAMLAMARQLGLDVVAEGVETEAQAAFLAERGVACLQGYLFATAEPAADWCGRHAFASALGGA